MRRADQPVTRRARSEREQVHRQCEQHYRGGEHDHPAGRRAPHHHEVRREHRQHEEAEVANEPG
jgi:hypothetical protein